MAEVILKNLADFSGEYDGETVVFSSNTVSTRILQGIEATKTANKDIWINGPLTYTIVVKNTSGATMTNVVFTDNLDSTLITLDQTAGVYVDGSPAVYSYSLGLLSINLQDLEDGETRTITFQVLQV